MGKGVLIAEIINSDGIVTLNHLGGDWLMTKQEALKIIEDVANGYPGSPKLAKNATIFFVEGKRVPIKIQTGKITASFEKKKPGPKSKKKKRKAKRKK